MKYRIKREGDEYFPQYKSLFWWKDFKKVAGSVLYCYLVSVKFSTHTDARRFILREKYPDFEEVEFLEVLLEA
jgi:hypothetical protein